MNFIQNALNEFEASPCYTCDMLSLIHGHSAEQAKNFKFGCEGIYFETCLKLRRLRLCGPPGDMGCDGGDEKWDEEKAVADAEMENQKYWDEITECQRILGDRNKTIW